MGLVTRVLSKVTILIVTYNPIMGLITLRTESHETHITGLTTPLLPTNDPLSIIRRTLTS